MSAQIIYPHTCSLCGREFSAVGARRRCHACLGLHVAKAPAGQLTVRQRQLVHLVSQGKLNKQIAWDLHLAEGSIKAYLALIFIKIGVTNRTELAVWSVNHPDECRLPPHHSPGPATRMNAKVIV